MIDNKKNELRDYLFTVLQKMDLDEEEVKVKLSKRLLAGLVAYF